MFDYESAPESIIKIEIYDIISIFYNFILILKYKTIIMDSYYM